LRLYAVHFINEKTGMANSAKSLLACLLLCFSLSTVHAQDSAALSSTGKPGRYFRFKSIVLPSTLVLYGVLKPVIPAIEKADDKIWENVNANHPDFRTKVDDYLMWAPSASVYILDAFKVKSKNKFTDHLILDAGSIVVAGGIGFVMRKISGNIEVYNKYESVFPSGHVTNAFRGAEFVFQEYKNSHPVISYSGYLFATTVAVLRIYNKTHLLTEVLAGAGLGMLSTKLTYLVFDKVKYRHKKTAPGTF
jgi:hypothetical protein